MLDPSDLNSMEKIAGFMRDNLPAGMTLATFGKTMKWGRGDAAALRRIDSLTVEELYSMRLTAEQAENWAAAYEAVRNIAPTNPSAVGRAQLMRHAARLLKGA